MEFNPHTGSGERQCDAGCPARPHWQLMRPARVRSSDFGGVRFIVTYPQELAFQVDLSQFREGSRGSRPQSGRVGQ